MTNNVLHPSICLLKSEEKSVQKQWIRNRTIQYVQAGKGRKKS
jgi:hypothetical protein